MPKIKNAPKSEPGYTNIFIAGALALDGRANAAYIISSEPLRLNSCEFETLYLLASHKDTPQSFEAIYNSVWEQEDGADRRTEAREAINGVVTIINAAGNGFAWIEHEPSDNYVYRTLFR